MLKSFKFLLSSLSVLALLAGCQQNNLTQLPQNLDNTQSQAQATNKFGTFKRDLWIAQSEARRWDFSSELIRVEANFVSESGSASWTYYFKSYSKRNLLRVSSGFGNEVPNTFFGREIREFDVRIDSDKAIEIAKTKGLKRFPVSFMTLENRFSSPEWEINSSDGFFRIDAQFGKVVSTEKETAKETTKK